MKLATSMICAVLCGFGSNWLEAREAEQAPQAPSSQSASPRELLKLFDIGETFFAGFADNRPLDSAERGKLAVLLYRMRQIPPGTLEEYRKSPRLLRWILENPAEYRGDVFSVHGTVNYVEREELAPADRDKSSFDAWYRCQIVTLFGSHVTLCTATIPAAWKLSEPIDERCSALALFVKLLGPDPAEAEQADRGGASESLLFVAPRVAWYPDNLLGGLRMDVGLLDGVRDRTELSERECFYQLLAAVRRAPLGRIERAGRKHLAEQRDFLDRLARNRHQPEKARADAKRALERAEKNADDVVPLFNDPAAQRGKLFVLPGEALRAIEVRVDDPDIVKRFGIDHYYEVEMVTADSQNNPIVCCVAELPADMPLGESIHENVSVTGFFLKTWAFDTQKSRVAGAPAGEANRKQLAPLLIAKTLRVLKPPPLGPRSTLLAAALVVAILVFAIVAWRVRRSDRRALADAGGRISLPEQIAVDDAQDAAGDTA